MHGSTRDVEDWLAVIDQQADSESTASIVQIGCPDHLIALCQGEHVGDHGQQLGLIISHAAREEPPAQLIDRHTVMVSFSSINARPQSRHRNLSR